MVPAHSLSGSFEYPASLKYEFAFKQPSWMGVFFWTLVSSVLVACLAFSLHLAETSLSSKRVSAAVLPLYQASVLSVSAPSRLAPGETSQVTVAFQNIGQTAWKKDGSRFVSLYRYDPQRKTEIDSLFYTSGWESRQRPTRVSTTIVTGGNDTLTFPIRAPNVPGTYTEQFILTVENTTRMKTGLFSLTIVVAPTTPTQSPSAQPPSQPAVPSVPPASAAVTSSADWSAQLVSMPGSEWQIDMGDHVMIDLAFKNTGTKIWTRDDKNFVSLYAGENKQPRSSLFKDFSWLTTSQAVKLKEATVKPGEVGHFTLQLRAPSLPGAYKETFTLAAENTAWLSGSTITLPIRVPLTSEFIATAPPGSDVLTSIPASQATPSLSGIYAASLLLRSIQALTLSGNGRQQLTFGFKNTGSGTWNSLSLRITGVMPALAGKLSSVRDDSWSSSIEPVQVKTQTKPGEVGFLTFNIKAPTKRGSYHASFKLHADGQPVDGGDIDIPITVTADGAIDPEPIPATPVSNNTNTTPAPSAIVLNNGDLPAEPIIRVGLFKTTDDQMMVRAKYAAASVMQGGATLCRLVLGDTVTVRYDRVNRVYRLSGGSCNGQSSDIYTIKADDGISPLEIADFSRPVSWLPGANDNTFRGQLELRFTPSTNNVWIINELPIEWYLKGIAETSNSSPQEYQKALLTAARTYAMYHVRRASKHANESYTVDATYDQVYRGYGAEARDANVVTAVDATRGQIVTYQGNLAITPYYSRSDGRTRSWTEVWGGGPYPWLVSVPVPWDQGKTLWGHGVGLSATGALGMANDGKKYDEILKYFYTSTDLTVVYR